MTKPHVFLSNHNFLRCSILRCSIGYNLTFQIVTYHKVLPGYLPRHFRTPTCLTYVLMIILCMYINSCNLVDGTIVKRLHEILPTFWKSNFNKCLLLGCYPAKWKEEKIVVTPKSDKTEAYSVAGYRRISLLTNPGKV